MEEKVVCGGGNMSEAKPPPPIGAGRFDYVKYDDEAVFTQELLKTMFSALGSGIEGTLPAGRGKALALTHLEESYMWVGKAIRDEQIKRNGSAPLQEERKNG